MKNAKLKFKDLRMKKNHSRLFSIQCFIFKFNLRFCIFLFCIFLFIFFLTLNISAQKIAVLAPEKNTSSQIVAEKLADAFSENVKVLDFSLSDAAYRSQAFAKPFNLTLAESKNVGAAVGADFFLLVKAENLRRASLTKEEFYESYAVVFTVSARIGRLVFWKLKSFEADKKEAAEKKLFDSIDALAAEISAKIKTAKTEEFNEKTATNFELLPEDDSPAAKNFRPPLPYKRMRPAYTPLANLYSVEATVDVEIDVSEKGEILKAETVRWAGFGLDESALENIRRMNWRPATRDGRPIPIRVLLRYNFKKSEVE